MREKGERDTGGGGCCSLAFFLERLRRWTDLHCERKGEGRRGKELDEEAEENRSDRNRWN